MLAFLCVCLTTLQWGASIPPEAMMHFPLCFRFSPCFQKIFLTLRKILNFTLFPIFIRQNFWWLFLVIDTTNFEFSVPFPPCFAKTFYFPPTFTNFPPVFDKFTCFYMLCVYFVSPLLWPWCIYASHNARTGRPCLQYPRSSKVIKKLLAYQREKKQQILLIKFG